MGNHFFHQREASKLHFLACANDASRKHCTHARDFVCAWDGAAGVDAEACFCDLDACPWLDKVTTTITADAEDVLIIAHCNRLAQGLLTLEANTRAFLLGTAALWIFTNESANGTTTCLAHADASYIHITQVKVAAFDFFHFPRLNFHDVLCFAAAAKCRIDNATWEQRAHHWDLISAWDGAPSIKATGLLLTCNARVRLHQEQTSFCTKEHLVIHVIGGVHHLAAQHVALEAGANAIRSTTKAIWPSTAATSDGAKACITNGQLTDWNGLLVGRHCA